MKYKMKMGGMEHEVRVVELDLDLYRVYIDDKEFDVEVEPEHVRSAPATPAASLDRPHGDVGVGAGRGRTRFGRDAHAGPCLHTGRGGRTGCDGPDAGQSAARFGI